MCRLDTQAGPSKTCKKAKIIVLFLSQLSSFVFLILGFVTMRNSDCQTPSFLMLHCILFAWNVNISSFPLTRSLNFFLSLSFFSCSCITTAAVCCRQKPRISAFTACIVGFGVVYSSHTKRKYAKCTNAKYDFV